MEIKKPAMAGTLESSDCQVTVEPVSYTHLDVYKRQHQSCQLGKVPAVSSGAASPCPFQTWLAWSAVLRLL